ncbi:MAG TPA: hypothetical protein VEL31_31330 [Ktedonobacteraceae bacterium]|nr:hypothetical protein [Ktedonobacteraceae bacterium]
MREVKVTVSPDGTTSSDFSGFVGPSCLDEAERLRQLLASRYGIVLQQTGFTAKPELSQQESQQQGQRTQRGQTT